MAKRVDQTAETLNKLSAEITEHPEIADKIEGVVGMMMPLIGDIALSLSMIADLMAIMVGAETEYDSAVSDE